MNGKKARILRAIARDLKKPKQEIYKAYKQLNHIGRNVFKWLPE